MLEIGDGDREILVGEATLLIQLTKFGTSFEGIAYSTDVNKSHE